MDFDPKSLMENAPRMKEDLKEYIKDVGQKIAILLPFLRMVWADVDKNLERRQ